MARTSSRRRRRSGLLLFGGVALAAGLAYRRRRAAAATSTPPPAPAAAERFEASSPAPAAGPSNYDTSGPVANTATPVPVPEAFESPSIDEAEEEAAAAAEAANIGGEVSPYAGPELGEPAGEADRPLEEAGQGVSEGQEQAEAELVEAAEPSDGMSPEQHQIEDVIESTESPAVGERVEPVAPLHDEEREQQAGDSPAPFREEEPPTQAMSPVLDPAPAPAEPEAPAPAQQPPTQAFAPAEAPVDPPFEASTEVQPPEAAAPPVPPAPPAEPGQVSTWGAGGWSPPQPAESEAPASGDPAERAQEEPRQTWSGRALRP